MSKNSRGFWLEVSGDFACFTRPELKSERMSYEIPTPSAVRAIFETILWKPAIRWQINKIIVMNKIDWISFRRNEVGSRASKKREGCIYIENDRVQRASHVLRNVKYRFHAEFFFIKPEDCFHSQRLAPELRPVPKFLMQTDFEEYTDWQKYDGDERSDETEAKYFSMFKRRASKFQHYTKPYLGCREFAADVRLIDPPEEEGGIQLDRNYGWMLFDMDYRDLENIKPLFYEANMIQGVIKVPPRNDNTKVKG
ncbi:MAG: type I-C CRISPR-associated protein Cas5c [Planctomycetaceae bacterium]|nr:type I-C CRISPR-associated protein Cas5c [Planctomycetaceae bacterium]